MQRRKPIGISKRPVEAGKVRGLKGRGFDSRTGYPCRSYLVLGQDSIDSYPAGATVNGYFTFNEKIRVRIPACSSIGRALTVDALDLSWDFGVWPNLV